LALDAGEEILQRGRVGRIAGEHLVGERQALGSHHQRNNHLYAVGPMIARIAEAAFVFLVQRWIGLEVRAREVIQEHIEAGVEQIPPPSHQVIEQRLLVLEQPVVTGVERVNVGKRGIGTQQIAERGSRSNQCRCNRHSLPGDKSR
jgi:hypothetical protein